MNDILGSSSTDILVVDDKPDNIRFLSNMLGSQGYNVRKALNGQMALTAVKTVSPDLILLDISMPELDGYEVCKHLKLDAKTSSIPVIFLTALDAVLDKVKAFQVGGVDYITKPFQFEEVWFYRYLYAKKNELTEFSHQILLTIYKLNVDTVRVYSFPG